MFVTCPTRTCNITRTRGYRCHVLSCIIVALVTIVTIMALSVNPRQWKKRKKNVEGGNGFFAETVAEFKTRKFQEFQQRSDFQGLSEEKIHEMSARYHRDLEVQWTARSALPSPKEMFHPQCMEYLHHNFTSTVSVIFTYHNELISLIFRAVTCVLHRTRPRYALRLFLHHNKTPRYLREIILIDDASDEDNSAALKKLLDPWRSRDLNFVLHRTNSKQGIANVRKMGIQMARGDVVIILDSHMEVSELWLEPLLDVLSEKSRAVATPCIHMISETSYEEAKHATLPYTISLVNGYGTLSFNPYVPENPDITLPYQSSGLAGGALAGRRSWLTDVYPRGILGRSWGVENSRLAIRAWLCGDGVWMSCCSQVTHPNGNDPALYRYLNESGMGMFDDLRRESVGEILNFIKESGDRDIFLQKVTGHDGVPGEPQDLQLNKGERSLVEGLARIIAEEMEGIDMNECRDYMWYLHHIHPNYQPFDWSDSHHVGEVQSRVYTTTCLESQMTRDVKVWTMELKLGSHISPQNKVRTYLCRRYLPYDDSHTVSFSRQGHVRTSYGICWTSLHNTSDVRLAACTEDDESSGLTQQISFLEETHQIRHHSTNRCITIGEFLALGIRKLYWSGCDDSDVNQQWLIRPAKWFHKASRDDGIVDLCKDNICTLTHTREDSASTAEVLIVFGIKGVDMSQMKEHVNSQGHGIPIFDEKFKVNRRVMEKICSICRNTLARTDLVRNMGGQQDCLDICDSHKLLLSKVQKWIPKYLGFHTENNATIVDWIALPFRSTTPNSISNCKAYHHWRQWQDFIKDQASQLDFPGELQSIFQTSERWSHVFTEIVLVDGAIRGIAISLWFCIMATIIFTGHPLQTLIVMSTIICEIGFVFGCFFLVGLELGAVEAISLAILVGTSVDYCVHLVEGYRIAGKSQPPNTWTGSIRGWRLRHALNHIGVPIVSSAITTVLAAVILSLTQIQMFSRFGKILAITMFLSLIYTLFMAGSLLAVFAPIKYSGSGKASLKGLAVAIVLTCCAIPLPLYLFKEAIIC